MTGPGGRHVGTAAAHSAYLAADGWPLAGIAMDAVRNRNRKRRTQGGGVLGSYQGREGGGTY